MRHQVSGSKLGRSTSHRRALLRNLAIALFEHERIETTEAKAKALRPYAERLITLGKRGDLHARRLAAQDIHDHAALQKLFGELGERYQNRPGGYTRILKLGRRRGDNGRIALIELVDGKMKAAPVADTADSSEEKAAE